MGRISAYLNALKDKNNLTQQQLADMTGIPVGTLPRYFGALDDDAANFEVVRKLVVAMHGSLDELAGIPLRQAERETRRANRATLIACIIGALFVLLVFIDALIPTRGWILR